MPTWDSRSEFKYAEIGGEIQFFCGTGFSHKYTIEFQEYTMALVQFSGQEVKIGTSRTEPPEGSIGAWLKTNFRKSGIMSYLGPFLIKKGLAERGTRPDQIRIKTYPAKS